jgi:hypothetical protein
LAAGAFTFEGDVVVRAEPFDAIEFDLASSGTCNDSHRTPRRESP